MYSNNNKNIIPNNKTNYIIIPSIIDNNESLIKLSIKRKDNNIINDNIINHNKYPKLDNDNKYQRPDNMNMLVAPSHLKNYILHEPLLDYLEYYKFNDIYDLPDKTRKTIYVNNEFDEYVKNKGIEYEQTVMNNYKYPYHKINSPISLGSFYDTIDALNKKIPIIYQGVLFDYKNKTYGCPDIIIRGDYLNKIYNQTVEEQYYYVIDIKWSTVTLTSDRNNICNSDFIPVYKSQILIYTNALNEILNQNVKTGFVLGKRYLSIKSNQKTIIDNINFDILGVIDYQNHDNQYYKIVEDAVDWVLKVRNEGHNWRLLPKPTLPELYPNMSNNKDGKWRPLKKKLADELKELTLIVHVGYKERNNAISKGIYSYDNIYCNSNILGIKGSNGTIVDEIIKSNSNNSTKIFNPDIIKYNKNDWRYINDSDTKMVFYLDYETTNDFEHINMIFMIGVGYENKNNEWTFESFITSSSETESQISMFTHFWNYINNLLLVYNKKEAVFIHWTDAEPSFYNRVQMELKLPQKQFLDLYKVFINEPITIKGALNYSLKTIAKVMYNHGLINTQWSSESTCMNGLDALIQANKIYKNNINVTKQDMTDIIYYNEIDCKVLYEIHNYIRKYH
jgi:hypothetical protein